MDDRLVTVRRWRRCCGNCGVIIDKGEQVHSGPYFGDGRVGRWWMHPVCHRVAMAVDWYDWPDDDRPPLDGWRPDEVPESVRAEWAAHWSRREVRS